ncbi:MAG: PDZ domain-containing protein [Ruminococcaceae bacterium]|nr:PDZ domain-containing protein [Oscillospiraceae bacterium]
MNRRKWGTGLAVLVLAALCLLPTPVLARTPDSVLLGGMPFGVRFMAEGIVVVGFSEAKQGELNPAYAAGLRQGDVITAVDGESVSTAEELSRRIGESRGLVEITYRRKDRERVAILCPAESERGRKAGLFIRDTVAGIGTVTWVDGETMTFGGLGHGICRDGTGDLIAISDGAAEGVSITGVTRGAPGVPGELQGIFTGEVFGSVEANTDCGVFGVFREIPGDCGGDVPVGSREDVHPGRAYIRCTVVGGEPEEYEVCITDINARSRDNRSFSIVVTDPELLERTGGIVQGMSGSPVLQDGRLVGAVTHVLVGDPAEGYGVFIDNMFEAAG